MFTLSSLGRLCPQLWTSLREGYTTTFLRHDAFAGLTVAIVALPLAMAIAIASKATPAQGLLTAIVAGALISIFGGSRVQIGGPTGAFIPVVAAVISQFNYDGMIIATLMAGVILMLSAWLGLGIVIRFIPQPVIIGFTAGIATIIASTQVNAFLGLGIQNVPAKFLPQWESYLANLHHLSWPTVGVGMGALALILALRRYAPRVPAFLVAVALAAVAVWAGHLPLETIGSKFGGVPSTLPMPSWPSFTLERLMELFPSALTIAFLAGIESLLSAVVSDSMTGHRHRPDAELMGQGIANTASALFGGLPATGAIARTVTNIRADARTPMSGVLHAGFLLVFVLVAAKVASYFPLAAMAAILLIVSWNMAEIDKIIRFMRHASTGERLTLLATWLLTTFVDLTVAIEVGIVMGALLFVVRMRRMFDIHADSLHHTDERTDIDARHAVGHHVQILTLRGPLFFGVIGTLMDTLDIAGDGVKVFVLDMTHVPMIDSSGVHGIADFVQRASRTHRRVVLCGMNDRVKCALLPVLDDAHIKEKPAISADLLDAKITARGLAA